MLRAASGSTARISRAPVFGPKTQDHPPKQASPYSRLLPPSQTWHRLRRVSWALLEEPQGQRLHGLLLTQHAQRAMGRWRNFQVESGGRIR